MRLFRITLIFSCVACCIFLSTCQAPRNNPLDPISNETPYLQYPFSIYSEVTNGYGVFKTKYEIYVSAKIVDRNQVIDSVFVESNYFQFKKLLSYNLINQTYDGKIVINDLKTDKFEDVVGHEFKLRVKDYSSRVFDLGTSSVTRVILNDIKIVSPINSITETNPLKLTWEQFDAKFSFNYKIKIFVEEYPDLPLIWESDNINSDSTSIIVNQTLPAGEYLWVIRGIDDFNNKFSSKPASFKIKL